MRRNKPYSLRVYLVGGSALLLLITIATLGGALVLDDYWHSIEAARDNAVIQARAVSRAAEPGLLLNDRDALLRVLDGAALNPSLREARVVDADGEQLAVFSRTADAHVTPERHARGMTDTDTDIVVWRDKRLLGVRVPVYQSDEQLEIELLAEAGGDSQVSEKPLGYVALAFSLDGVYVELGQHLLSAGLVTVLVLLIGTGTALLFVRRILNPLDNLVQATAAIAEGDLGRRASEQAIGEFGTLAASFNHMAQRVQDAYASIGRKVADRTAELQARRRELETEVAVRRRAEAELNHAKQVAEAANRAKSEFLANMSHEIRTPMTAIVGFADVLFDELACCEQCLEHAACAVRRDARVAISTIQRNGHYLLDIINDILDLSKIEVGRLELEHLPTNTEELVQGVIGLVKGRAEAKGLELVAEQSREVPVAIEVDPLRLRQILINIVSNAIKFTERGRVQVQVSWQPYDAQVGMFYVDVIDTGIGMAPDQVERAFSSFQQADGSMTRRFGGTGLGLTISRRLARMLGGDVQVVYSQPNRGTHVRVSVKTSALHELADSADGAREPARVTGVVGAEPLKGVRVLLAEDGPDNQRLIVHFMKRAGAAMQVVENGQEAVEAALAGWRGGEPFDLILMDMQMPVMDGYEATRKLREAGYAGLVVALTAHAMSGHSEQCFAAGCNEYLTKPIKREVLVQAVQRLVEGARSSHG